MKIIKKGNINQIPGHRKYEGKCPKCDCEFEFKDKDILYDQRENDSWVHCPTCGNAISMTSRYIIQL